MAIRNESDHVSDVMADALSHLNRVVEHVRVPLMPQRLWLITDQLRGEGENEAANGIARDVHSMLDTFNHTTAPWAFEKFQMKPAPAARPQQIAPTRATTPADARSNASTWAAVAATDIPRSNRLVKFRPSDGLKRHITDGEAQSQDEDYRCVWIYGWSKDRPLSIVTERISSGAIFSMVYVDEYEAVCVIFQHASSALIFVDDNLRSVRDVGVGLFGQSSPIRLGEAYADNADLQRMAPPINERRRLTFARQQLFANGMTEDRFKRDIVELVGRHNVELVWLFNTGNGKCLHADHLFTSNEWPQPPLSSLRL